jgi:hypothetical protein
MVRLLRQRGRSAGEPEGSFLPKRRSASYSMGFEASRAVSPCRVLDILVVDKSLMPVPRGAIEAAA